MKKAFTLVEVVFTVAIAGILIVGTSEMLSSLSTSSQRAKTLSNLSLDTQSAIDQISSLLYYRVPNSAIAYDRTANFQPIVAMRDNNRILEWIGVLHEATMNGSLSTFIDMQASTFATRTLNSPMSNFNIVNATMKNKFPGRTIANTALFFAGSFDSGVGDAADFGWHSPTASNLNAVSGASGGNRLVLTGTMPTFIYEKFYLADTAYAVARGADVNQNAKCIKDLEIENAELNNALILFYDYRPWNHQTFCADRGTRGTHTGSATLLSLNVTGLKVNYENFTIRLSIDASRDIRGLSGRDASSFVRVTKQKVVF